MMELQCKNDNNCCFLRTCTVTPSRKQTLCFSDISFSFLVSILIQELETSRFPKPKELISLCYCLFPELTAVYLRRYVLKVTSDQPFKTPSLIYLKQTWKDKVRLDLPCVEARRERGPVETSRVTTWNRNGK